MVKNKAKEREKKEEDKKYEEKDERPFVVKAH